MARRRMFSLELISSDKFLGLPSSAQSFYFHLNMHADDEGFVAAPRSLGMLCGGSNEDLELLEKADFVIRFESGVLVITHWLLNNTIRKDRSVETIHRAEKAMLALKDGCYVLAEETPVTTNVATNLATNPDAIFSAESAPQNRIEENRIEKNILENNRIEYPGGEKIHQPGVEEEWIAPSCVDIALFVEQENLPIDAMAFWSKYYKTGWKDSRGVPIKDWKALARSWRQNADTG